MDKEKYKKLMKSNKLDKNILNSWENVLNMETGKIMAKLNIDDCVNKILKTKQKNKQFLSQSRTIRKIPKWTHNVESLTAWKIKLEKLAKKFLKKYNTLKSTLNLNQWENKLIPYLCSFVLYIYIYIFMWVSCVGRSYHRLYLSL